MNEIHFGAPWPLSFAALLRTKVMNPAVHRKIALEGHRFTPKEALAAGLVDYIVEGNTAAILAKAEEVAETLSPLAREGVWGIIKVRSTLNIGPARKADGSRWTVGLASASLGNDSERSSGGSCVV
ncbi:hypothetical protein HWV62_6071 [Athelia sp. TMB]|nr:hypothetical protein HWV62_6071 [Athelia sp. TMB]